MIKKYEFNYNYFDASCIIEVNHSIFTKEMALEVLKFFIWDYNKENDPILEVLKKYAAEILRIATSEFYNEIGVISEFENKEGYFPLNEKSGLKLIEVCFLNFDDVELDMDILE